MNRTVSTESLTPLERLELRESLQDRWREQRRLITLLTLQYDVTTAEGGAPASSLDTSALELAIHRARTRLASIEAAMRRLDDGTHVAA